jgi:hypothetical protein
LFHHHDTDPVNAISNAVSSGENSRLPRRGKNDRSRVSVDQGNACGNHAMPSLLRVLVVVGIVGALGYAAMYMLANYVDPKTREMSVTVPPDHFVKRQ